MELKAIIKSELNGIVTLTINRPSALNAINAEIMDDLYYLFSEGLDFKALVGVIITGSGDKAFAAGADIKEFPTLSKEEASALSRRGHSVYNLIETCKVPVIAAVNGFSLGGGNELAMACHIRIASHNARFGQPEVNLGLIPGYGGVQRLIQYIGKGRATELLLTGGMIDAATALEYGLITHLTEPSELLPTAEKILSKISGKGPNAISKIIEGINSFYNKEIDGFKKEIEDFGTCLDSSECREGVSAFVEKRKANFRN